MTVKNQKSSSEPNWFHYPPIDEVILQQLREREHFIVIGHLNPDGDCLSSQFAVEALLHFLGKEVTLANAGPLTRSEISHLDGQFVSEISPELYRKNPLVVVVDCSSADRLGHLASQIEGLDTVIFDHHSSGEQFGTWRYIIPRSISTTLIIMHLYREMDIEITEEIAEHLFFGFATDSGFFRFITSYRGETLRMAADLVDLGVSPNAMVDRMSGGKQLAYVQYLGALINRVESHYAGKVLSSVTYAADDLHYNTADKPSDALYGHLLSVAGVEVVLFFKELASSVTEVGFRSSYLSEVDVGKLAESLGGGGHRKASGVTIKSSLADTKKLVLSAIESLL